MEQEKSESLIEQITLITQIMENETGKGNLWNPLISVICDSDNVMDEVYKIMTKRGSDIKIIAQTIYDYS